MSSLDPVNQDKFFFKEQLKECLYEQRLMIKENQFWQEFSEHILIAFSFLCLGIIIGIFITSFVLRHKVKLDYDIPKGTILRVNHKDNKWLITRPRDFMQVLDIILLCIFDRGSSKYVDKHDKRRIRILRIILFIILSLLILIGTLEILSALAWSMNPFDYLYRLK